MRTFFVVSFFSLTFAEAQFKDGRVAPRNSNSNIGASRGFFHRQGAPARERNNEGNSGGAGAGFLGVVFGGLAAAGSGNGQQRQRERPTNYVTRSSGNQGGGFFGGGGRSGFSPGRTAFLNYIDNYEGSPYVWGAEGPRSFDCTGFVSHVLQEKNCLGDNVRLTSGNIPSYLTPTSNCKPGDIIRRPGHAAFYLSPGRVYGAVGGSLDEVTAHSYSGTCYQNPCFD